MRRTLVLGMTGLAIALVGARAVLDAGDARADPNAPLSITNTAPADAIAGQTDFLLKVYGDGFPADVGESDLISVTWNGAAIPATIKSSTELHIVVPADLVRDPAAVQLGVQLTGGGSATKVAPFRVWRSSGDVNCTGTVTSSDALHLMRVLAELTSEGNCSVDANQDGEVDLEDVQWVLDDVARLVHPLKATVQN